VTQLPRATIETVLHNTYAGQTCSVARTLELVGERWTLLILRDAFLGVRRFDDFQRDLGVARNVLNTRLQRLCDAGLLERRLYQQRPERYEYRLTEMGRDLWPVIVALMEFGDRHLCAEDGPPMLLHHRDCGGEVTSKRTCTDCGADLEARDVVAAPGPGAGAATRARLAPSAP
jgi:DNA-binding HxlR family transcriptional regulator